MAAKVLSWAWPKRSDVQAVEAEALRSVAQLALATAHEINNPLTVIIGSLQLMVAQGQVPDDTAGSIERVIRAAEQIRDVVRNMSRITRLELSRQSPLPDVIDLRYHRFRRQGAPTGEPAGGRYCVPPVRRLRHLVSPLDHD
jgi:signal transduction histidine kinase